MVDVTSPPTQRASRSSVSAADWVDAAVEAFARGGLAAVRVEPLARQLGVTKGSFYWHFSDREALLAAVVERWESEHTDAMIAEAQRGDTAAERLRRLLFAVSSRFDDSHGEQLLYLEAEHEGVRASVDRVTSRRLDYVAEILVELGHERADAERRSFLALAAATGMQQLLTGAPQALSRPALSQQRFIGFLYDLLVEPPAGTPSGAGEPIEREGVE
jgi:AcrR family transcriptional regulator